MAERVTVKIAAKVNLSLNITGRAGGYHLLDSVFASLGIYNTVTAVKRAGKCIDIVFSDTGIDPRFNRARMAADMMSKRYGGLGAEISVVNNIPTGRGLGGSSADAAGVIIALNRLFGLTDDQRQLNEIAASVGSDTPFMLRGGLARVTGRGEKINYFSGRTDKKIVVVSPASEVSTAECFRRFDDREDAGLAADTDAVVAALIRGEDFTPFIGNALYPAAVSLNPDIAEAYKAVASAGGRPVMTGSGSACLGFFDSMPDSFAGRQTFLTDAGVITEDN